MDEMEDKQGDCVLPKKKVPTGAKIAIIAVAAVLALAAGGYFGLCAYVSGGVILPNTTAAGVALGGLQEQTAADRLQKEIAARYAERNITFTYPGGMGEISGAGVEVDAAAVAKNAAALGRERGFIGGGAAYLGAFFGGSEVPAPLRFSQTGGAEFDRQVAEMEDHLTRRAEQTTYRLKENDLLLVKGVSGSAIDVAAVKAAALTAFSAFEDQQGQPAFAVEPQVVAPETPDFGAIYTGIKVEAADAYLDKTSREIVPSVTGISFDIATAQALLERTEEGAVCRVPLNKTQPKMTTEKLHANLFKDVLGQTKTYCSGPLNRRKNIDLACSFVNGTILLPGEEFSYTGACGPYSLSHGYLKAGAYQNGKTVDTTAGGICQLSSTLYWATLEANLKTVERAHHGFDGGYMPIIGTDATVFGDSPDFRFQNDTEYPIKLESYQDESHNLHVTIYGTGSGIRGEPFNRVVATNPPITVYEPSALVPQGGKPQKDPERTAYTGKTVEVYLRLVDAEGKTVDTRFLHKDTYSSRNGVMLYNPADAALWGIDPATGKQTLAPVTPTATPDVPAVTTPPATTEPGATTSPTPGATTPVTPPDPEQIPPSGTPIIPPVTAAPAPTPVPTE